MNKSIKFKDAISYNDFINSFPEKKHMVPKQDDLETNIKDYKVKLLFNVLNQLIEMSEQDNINNAWAGDVMILGKDTNDGLKLTLSLVKSDLSDEEIDWIKSQQEK